MKSSRLRVKDSSFYKNARTHSTQLLRIPNSQQKLSPDLPPINPDLCLSRSSILEQDKKKRLNSYISHTVSTDISHLLDSPKLKFTPKTSTVFIEHLYTGQTEIKTLPSGRIEIEHLRDWLEKMKNLYLPELDQMMTQSLVPDSEFVTKVEEIYLKALKEIINQVSVQSKLRAELIESIFSAVKYVWTRYPDHLNFLLGKEKENTEKVIEKMRAKYKVKIGELKNEKKRLEKNFRQISDERDELEQLAKTQAGLLDSNEKFIKESSDYRARKLLCTETGTQTMIDLRLELERSLTSRLNSNRVSMNLDSSMKSEISSMKINLIPDSLEPKTPIDIQLENIEEEVQKLAQNFDFDLNFDIETLKASIKKSENLPDWFEGFKLGMNYLSKYQENEEKKQGLVTQVTLPSPTLHIKNKKEKFKMNSPRKLQPVKLNTLDFEENSSVQLIKSLLERSQASLQKHQKNSKKKILKHINQALYYAMGKKLSQEFTLAELVLQQFCNKNNVRSIAERKFKELVVGCILNSASCLRIKLFLCVLNAGSYCDYPDYSLETSEMYIKLYEFMINSKVGIVYETAFPLDISSYPVARAYECIKQLLSPYIHPEKVTSLLSTTKKLAVLDHSHVNKEGVINLDLFIDTVLPLYEQFIQSTNEGVKLATEVITEYNYLNKRELFILFRHLMPKKMGLVNAMKFDENDLINVEDFRTFCINNKICTFDSISPFFDHCEKDLKVVLHELDQYETEFHSKSECFTEESLSMSEWLWKFQYLLLNLKSRKSLRYLQMWHLLKNELNHLQASTIFSH